jgi:Cu(I)/Ag(I) efflux system protein CusF
MKFVQILVAVALASSVTVQAQPTAQAPEAARAADATVQGEVRKIDREQGKLTLKHGPIPNLDMPGMTMVFKVVEPKMLDNLKPGDKVKFAASNKDGAITVTAIEMAK